MGMDIERESRKQVEVLRRGVADIVPENELIEKIAQSLKSQKPLKIKLGLDPTAPDIHLGHTVVLNKLRQFQEFGHEIHILIGDFTGRIGDPSGRSETRKQLTEEQVKVNARTYQKQIFKVLDSEKTVMHFNSTWLSKLTFEDIINLAGKYTVARLMERDDFSNRFKEGIPIGVHEFLYPLMQGYDSIHLQADVELGGTDQTFNLLFGRHLQREYGMEPQVVITMPILEGTDGVQKMSKSLGNYIGVDEAPDEMFGKLMSIPDDLIIRYFELLTMVPIDEIRAMDADMKSGKLNPRDAKIILAKSIIAVYHNVQAADEAETRFKLIFSKKDIPDDIPEIQVSPGILNLPQFMKQHDLADSLSEGRRLLQQNAVKIDGDKYTLEDYNVTSTIVLQVGKRKFLKLTV